MTDRRLDSREVAAGRARIDPGRGDRGRPGLENVRALCLAAAVVLATNSHAAIINVPGDQPTIQAGINAAVNGDEIVVAPDTYNEAIAFSGKTIAVRSALGPAVTIIDATLLNATAVTIISSNLGIAASSFSGNMAANGGGLFTDGVGSFGRLST